MGIVLVSPTREPALAHECECDAPHTTRPDRDLRGRPQMSARLVLRHTSAPVQRPCRLVKGEFFE